MSLAHRQQTCAACGKPFVEGELINVEPLIDGPIRYVATHWNESTMVRGFNNHKADVPQTSVVLRVPNSDLTLIQTLIDAYADVLPPKLNDLLSQFVRNIPAPPAVDYRNNVVKYEE